MSQRSTGLPAGSETPASTTALPLEGVVVVELGDSASAPFAGKALAEMGAEVWKAERPTGDSSRGWGPSTWMSNGASFYALNRGKKLISVDIKDPQSLEQLRAFIATRADVFLHNLRPGSSVRYGLDAKTLLARTPALIHCEVGAFGHVGPKSTLPGYDPLMQAYAGIMSFTGEQDGQPSRAGVSIVDFGSGMWSVIGILAALHRRQQTGEGAAVSASLFETALAWMTVGIANYNTDGDLGGRFGSGAAFIAPHRAYPTCDGDLALGCANDTLFAALCRALGHDDWATDARFLSNNQRLTNRAVLDSLITAELKTAPRAHWINLLGEHGVPCAPVQTIDEVVSDEQTLALDIVGKLEKEGPDLVGLPLSFDGRRPPPGRVAREVGADNAEYLHLLNHNG